MSVDGELDGTSTCNDTSPQTAAQTCDLAAQNEPLCFVQQKNGIIAFDQLVKLCADFYRKEEIITARTVVEQ